MLILFFNYKMSKFFIPTPLQQPYTQQAPTMRPPDKIDHLGTQYWYLPGTIIYHNEEGPALLFASGTAYYYLNGKRNRKGGLPTITGPGGYEEYHVDSKLHRDNDLPAKIDWDGTKYYFQHGNLERANGLPTVEYLDGGKIWHRDNKKVKYYFPAIEWTEGSLVPAKYKVSRLDGLKVAYNTGNLAEARVILSDVKL
jgi:hypothetical protein